MTRNGDKVVKENASDVLAYVLEDAKKDFTITRFKGLGEMNPEQLWETTMNAETRTLLKCGSTTPPPPRKFSRR